MAHAVFYGAMSLDGYLADKEDGLNWLYHQEGGELVPYDVFYQAIDYTMMGRRTYEVVKRDAQLEILYPEKENFVFSHTDLDVDDNLQVVNERSYNVYSKSTIRENDLGCWRRCLVATSD